MYCSIALLLLTGVAAIGHAATLGGSIGVASDDVFRGRSQTDGQICPQGDLHYTWTPWYVGLSAEGVRRGRDEPAGAEVTAYIGYQQPIGADWQGGLSLRHYDYPGDVRRTRYNYDEAAATLAWRSRLILTVVASPDTYIQSSYQSAGHGHAFAYELSGNQPLPGGFWASAGFGYYDLRQQFGTGYAYWSAGLARPWRAWNFDLRYMGTDAAARELFGSRAADRLVASVLWSF